MDIREIIEIIFSLFTLYFVGVLLNEIFQEYKNTSMNKNSGVCLFYKFRSF
jgi:hypothetical protein